MRLWKKILLFSFVVTLILVTIGVISVVQLQNISKYLDEEIKESIIDVQKASEINEIAKFIRYYDEVLTQSARNYAFTGDKKWANRYNEVVFELDVLIKQAIEKGDAQEKTYFSSVEEANILLVQMEVKSFELVNNNKSEEAIEILESEAYWEQKRIYEKGLRDYVEYVGGQYNELLDSSTIVVESAANETQALVHRSRIFLIFTFFIALLFSIFLSIFVASNLSKPIMKLRDSAKRIGKGDFSDSVIIKSNDELEELANEINNMSKKLQSSKRELEKKVSDRTKELQRRVHQLEEFEDVTSDRELRINELKKEINELYKTLGDKEKYDLSEIKEEKK